MQVSACRGTSCARLLPWTEDMDRTHAGVIQREAPLSIATSAGLHGAGQSLGVCHFGPIPPSHSVRASQKSAGRFRRHLRHRFSQQPVPQIVQVVGPGSTSATWCARLGVRSLLGRAERQQPTCFLAAVDAKPIACVGRPIAARPSSRSCPKSLYTMCWLLPGPR